jgi:hypothetical protein
MSPDFEELVGGEGSPEELASLRFVHDLLVSADPPPPDAVPPPTRLPRRPRARRFVPQSKALAAAGLAACVAAVTGVAVGYSVWHGSGFEGSFTRPMHGVGATAAASAVINVGPQDAAGNRSLRMTVRALPALPHGRLYDLYLTETGKPRVLCGRFETGPSGAARVLMNAPEDLGEYDGWIVTAAAPGPQRVLLTT